MVHPKLRGTAGEYKQPESGQRHSSLYRASLTLAREEDVTAPPLRLREVLSGRATFGGKASRVKKAPQGT